MNNESGDERRIIADILITGLEHIRADEVTPGKFSELGAELGQTVGPIIGRTLGEWLAEVLIEEDHQIEDDEKPTEEDDERFNERIAKLRDTVNDLLEESVDTKERIRLLEDKIKLDSQDNQ